MANKPITMLKLRRIIQFKKHGHSNRQISRKLHLARDTVNEYVKRMQESGKSFKQLLKLSDQQLATLMLNPSKDVARSDKYTDLQGRLEGYANDLSQSTKTTKQILWEEYRKEVPDGYSRSQFCEYLIRYQRSRKAVMHFEHEPGDLMEFDFAGDPLYYVDTTTGEMIKCPVLICVLPCSGYCYVEALPSQRRDILIATLGRALDYFGGVPKMVKSDNMKQFVVKANRYEPRFDLLSEQWSLHYDTTLIAARVRKPRDKASVESSVNTAYYRIYAPLRNEIFHSLSQINQAIYIENQKLNQRNFQGKDYSRYDKFVSLEKTTLQPLPEAAFVQKNSQGSTVRPNYHVKLSEDGHYYSVPSQYIAHKVKIIYDTDNVEIYLPNYQRIATHHRNYKKEAYTTVAEHMPSHHRKYLIQKGWNQQYFLNKAKSIGPNTEAAIQRIFKQKNFVEQTYNTCIGTIRLAEKYGPERLEAACGRALPGHKINYTILKNILSRNLDTIQPQTTIDFFLPKHDNLRGPDAFNQ